MSKAIVVFLLLVALAVHTYGLSTSGNRILDKNGSPILLRGVARPSLEWSLTGERIDSTDIANIRSWGANVVRLSLNQCFWLNTPAYATKIADTVNLIKAQGMYAILDLHWSEGSSGATNCDQRNMADDRSVLFWQQVAAAYKSDPMVGFELYNEPHDVSWSIWRSGGDAGGYHTPGMQGLINAVRGTGANNLVVVNGLNWAYDLSGVPSNSLTGSNIAYGSHPYDFNGKQPSDWDAGFGNLAATAPVILTEFGNFNCASGYITSVINYCDARSISYTGWAWYPGGCGFPSLINDWSGTPSVAGALVKQSLTNGPKVPSSATITGNPSTTTVKPSTTGGSVAPTTTVRPTSSSGTKITVTMNGNCNNYWIAVDIISGATKITSTIQFKDSSSGAVWVTGAAQNWGTGNSVGWAWSANRLIVAPISLLLKATDGSTVTLTNIIPNLSSAVSYLSTSQYP